MDDGAASFLGPLFKAAPRFEQRQALLFNAKDSTSTPMPFTLKLVYSPSTMALGLQNALRDDGGVLPDHLRDQRRLVVWKRAPRLGHLMKKKKRGDSNDNTMHSNLTGCFPVESYDDKNYIFIAY